MPAYAKEGKVLCHFQRAPKFKTRHATLGFSDEANLDESDMWPCAFALKELTAMVEERVSALVKKSGGLCEVGRVSSSAQSMLGIGQPETAPRAGPVVITRNCDTRSAVVGGLLVAAHPLRPRSLNVALDRLPATAMLALAALGGSAVSASVPGPRQPIEHISVSGANFNVRSGNPGCCTGAGSLGFGYRVPRGAMITGATVYIIDTSPTAAVFAELFRHDFATGASGTLDCGVSSGTTTDQIELTVDPGYVVTAGQAINVVVTVASGTCFKGAEVHYIAHPDPTATGLRTRTKAPSPDLRQTAHRPRRAADGPGQAGIHSSSGVGCAAPHKSIPGAPDTASPPAEFGGNVAQHAVQEVRVVVDTELVRNRQKQRVCRCDRLVLGEIDDQPVRLPGVGLAESGNASVEVADLVPAAGLPTEVCAIHVADDRKDAAAH